MYLDETIELSNYTAVINGVSITYDGCALAVALDDGSALNPKQARTLLESLSYQIRSATGAFADTALLVAANKAAAEEQSAAGAQSPEADPAPVQHRGGGDWRPSIAAEKEASRPPQEAPAESSSSAPAKGNDAIEVPTEILNATRVKQVVAYYLDKGLNADGVWAACQPIVEQVPALKRLRNPEERIRRVATAYEG